MKIGRLPPVTRTPGSRSAAVAWAAPLSDGAGHTFTVTATNSLGTSAASVRSAPVVPTA